MNIDIDKAPRGLGMTSIRTIGLLYVYGAQSMREIALESKRSTAAATGIVDRLEKRGFAVRFWPPGDRRKTYVRLTEAGKDTAREIFPS